jgi:predicted nucleotidyltransferase component of viral defense system
MQLKAMIKKRAKESNIRAQLVMQTYMLERLLKRISLSRYKGNFILKGGFLIAAIVGLNTRATKDLDTTIKGLKLTHEVVREVFTEVCQIKAQDNLKYELTDIANIREADRYAGIRVKFKGTYETLCVPLFIDITAGDKITPEEVSFKIPSMFDKESIEVFAYNLETVLAEKLETIFSRGIVNTRPRDFYDVFILVKLHKTDLNYDILKQALNATGKRRGSLNFLKNYKEIMAQINNDKDMTGFWRGYQREFNYARETEFNEICEVITNLLDELGF